MRKLIGAILMLLFLVGAYFFVKDWNATASWGVGTGKIAAKGGGAGNGKTSTSTPAAGNSLIKQISQDPQKFAGKRVIVNGRVRGNSKYASNRNIYRLTDGQYSILVVDDKAAPKEYWPRMVSGIVKTIKPPVGKGYAYVVSVKGNPNIALKWTDVSSFFTTKYNAVKTEVKRATH